MIAEGVLAISRLSQKFNLSRLYPDLLERCESDRKGARHELLSLLLSIQGISNKKALVLLRDLHFQCVWDYPLEDLPMPVDTHVLVVMKRMGFIQGVKRSTIELEVQSVARAYFSVPVIADLAIWEIGNKFCEKGKPLCSPCFASPYCQTGRERLR